MNEIAQRFGFNPGESTDDTDYNCDGRMSKDQHPTPEFCLGPVTQIPIGEGREFKIGDTAVAVFRTRNGGVYATQAFCPHRAGPLIDGLLGGATLVCPLHAWKFDLATGQAALGDCGLTVYPVRLTEAGAILLRLERY